MTSQLCLATKNRPGVDLAGMAGRWRSVGGRIGSAGRAYYQQRGPVTGGHEQGFAGYAQAGFKRGFHGWPADYA